MRATTCNCVHAQPKTRHHPPDLVSAKLLEFVVYTVANATFDQSPDRSMMPAREKGEFYKKDRKVLRFFCKYKDSRLQGDKRDYILYYYLLNDTIEIKEVGCLFRRALVLNWLFSAMYGVPMLLLQPLKLV